MKKLSLFLAVVMCFSVVLSGCNRQGAVNSSETTTVPVDVVNTGITSGDGTISLPVNFTDGLNPYFAKCNENLYLCSFLFEPLFAVDETYKIKNVLAESIVVNDLTARVTIRTDAVCYGSNAVNADDVVYSFNMAKASYAWSGSLSTIISATAVDYRTVDFALEFSDVLVSGKLNFPIVKQGTADIQDTVPSGSGDYYFSENQLVSVADSTKIIKLCSIDTSESAKNAFKIGNTDLFFSDLADCNYSGVISNPTSIQLNNMVYVGLNSARGQLTSHIRSAIATAIDSEDIATSAYQGHATAMKLPVNPLQEDSVEYSVNAASDMQTALNIIDRCGYTRFSGEARSNGAYALKLNMIVNNDNKYRLTAAYLIADKLKECGIILTVIPLAFEDYSARIISGDYDLYLGEVKLDNSMDLSVFFQEGAALSSGINKTEPVVTEYYRYRKGEITATEYYKIFAEYFPVIPVCFRKGYVEFTNDIPDTMKQTIFR